MTNAILYTFRRCPYAIRARMALFAAKINVEIREVVLKDKPLHMLEISPKGTVPVLLIQENVIDESLEIMKWALAQTSLNWLDFNKETQQKIHQTIHSNDTTFKFHLDRYKYPQRYQIENHQPHFVECCKFLQQLQERLSQNLFLFANHISLADIAIFPFVRQFSKVDITAFENLNMPQLHKWLSFHESSDLFQSIMDKYSKWIPGDKPLYFHH